MKIPYMLVIGEKEIENDMASVRKRDIGDIGQMSIEEFVKVVDEEIKIKIILKEAQNGF
jgi:threonyl-tRNA synthetase (EC 6.1.1.3)/Ser-tRNA(Thr) hydrolase (EC 3.1.1.-)